MQLMQNYFSAAAVIGSQKPNQNEAKDKQVKFVGLLGLKKAAFNSELEQIKESEAQFENTQGQNRYQSNASMMQQMKEYQESCDINQHSKSNKLKAENDQEEEGLTFISPNKNIQRSSQSCTPQKKNMIIVNK